MTASAPAHPATSTRRRPWPGFTVLSLLALVPVTAVSVFRAIPVEWPTLVVQLVSFTPWLVLPAAVALLLAILGRRAWACLLAGALLALQLFWLFAPDHARYTPGSGPLVELRAMNINSEFGQADAAGIVRLVRSERIGVLTVQEHSQGLEDRLAAEGLPGLLPYRISDPTDDGAGSAVYSAYPLQLAGVVPDSPFQIPTVRLSVAGGEATATLEVTNVHTLPPVDTRVGQWRSDLAAVGRIAAQPGNRLLVGDFNSTYDHAEFRRLLDGGYTATAGGGGSSNSDGDRLVDVGTASGGRLTPTWPMEGMVLPGIVIDHFVVTPGISYSGYSVHRIPGTDHAAVVATLGIPAR